MNKKNKLQCARCGRCTVVCPVFRVTGRETFAARGKLHLLSTELAEHPSGHFQDIFSRCLLCGACEDNCSRQLPILDQIVQARSTFSHLYGRHPLQKVVARMVLSRPALLEGLVMAGLSLSSLSLLPADSGLRIKLGLLEKKEKGRMGRRKQETSGRVPGGLGINYFSGCMARYLQPSIGRATVRLAEAVTGGIPHEPDSQGCCGLAAWSAGKIEEARKLARKNIEVFAQTPGAILTSCASCSSHLKKYPALFENDPVWLEKAEAFSARVQEFTSFVDAGLPAELFAADPSCRVYYHEPCHLRFDRMHKGKALRFLGKVDNISLAEPDTDSRCCGQGGLFHLGYPELSGQIFSTACEQLDQYGAEIVVTTCSGCLMQWQAGLATRRSPVRAVHLALWLQSCMRKKS